jgi:hypothetical protein
MPTCVTGSRINLEVTAVTTSAPQRGDGETPIVRARVPAELKSAALRALGDDHASDTKLIRAALAALAGLPVDQHAAPLPLGRLAPRQAAA